jgi:DNA-binding helix-hairpin-helix protein with protein kinase domain
VAILIAVVGFFTSVIVGWIGMGLTAVFGIWWAVLINMPDFRHERSLRKEEAHILRKQFAAQQQLWDQTHKQTQEKFDQTIETMRQTRDEALSIRSHFEAEKRELQQTGRQSQLSDFLEAHPIPRNHLSMVGTGRFTALLSYGIETAADVNEARLRSVPGMDSQTAARLLAWRADIEKEFVFDPTKALSPARLSALILKYRQMQQTCEARLAGGVEELMLIRDGAQAELNAIGQVIQRLANEVRQADADASVL